MLSFEKLKLKDITKIRPYFQNPIGKICDNTIGGIFMWRDYFSTEFTEFNETLIFKAKIKYNGGITAFTIPIGKDLNGSLKEIAKYCAKEGISVAFCAATKENTKILKDHFDEIELHNELGWNDYIYNASDLIALSGKKFNGQRNHINYFKKANPNYSFEEITHENINEVKEFHRKFTLNAGKNTAAFIEEQIKTIEVFDNFDTYDLIGGLIKSNGEVVAFSIGEVSGNMLYVHIEKADVGVRGAYQMMVNEFAKHYASNSVEFINREEDDGDEGLRISKLSYHPCEIIEKYTAKIVP